MKQEKNSTASHMGGGGGTLNQYLQREEQSMCYHVQLSNAVASKSIL